MTSAKRAAIRLKEPVKHLLDGVSDAYTSKVNRPAMRAAGREPFKLWHVYSFVPAFAGLSAEAPAGFRIDGEA
jgi:hypothetical protein